MDPPNFDVNTFGEIVLRLSVPSGQWLEAAMTFNVHAAGAEANVVSLLSGHERKTCWYGALPNNLLGRFAENHLRAAGVNPDGIMWCK